MGALMYPLTLPKIKETLINSPLQKRKLYLKQSYAQNYGLLKYTKIYLNKKNWLNHF